MTIDMEFVIPLEKDDLLKRKSGQFSVEELTPQRSINSALDATRSALQNSGPRFILEHFGHFFSVLVHGNKIDHTQTLRAFDRIAKSLELLVTDMEKKFPTESRAEYLCINKMHAYILCSLMSYLEDTTLALDRDIIIESGRKKKAAKKPEQREEWEVRRSKTLLVIHRWLQLPLQNLWQPPIVEESFVQLIADICYKTLEHDKDNRTKTEARDTIFQILGVLVKSYLHKITCTIRIIQLVKMHEAFAPYLAVGIADMVIKNNCPGFIAELAREIEQTSLEESSARNVSAFLEAIATNKPELILPILPSIIDYLSNECYSMRNCAINVLGVVIQNALTKENLSSAEKHKRNECFELLETHMCDTNTYVRSRVLQVLQKLCCEGAIPVDRFGILMSAVVPHLREKAATVRKQALVLLRTLLEGHPFRAFVDKQTISKKKSEIIRSYEKIQEDIVAASGSGDEERQELWKKLSPQIVRAIKDHIDHESEDRDSDGEEDEEDEGEEENDSEVYEEIRNLIIDKNFKEALKKVSKISKIENASLADDFDDADKERFYHHTILFIFMESSRDGATHEETNAKFRDQKKEMMKLRQILIFLNNAETFATEIENAMIQIELMLFSPTAAVAIEACSLLASAMKLRIPGAAAGIRKAVSQVFSREESVRNNIALIYRDIYLLNNGEKATPSSAVNGLIHLFKGLQGGQSPALAHLISIWLTNKDLTEQHIEMMWQKYARKIPGTTVDDSRCAILLLAMVAQSQPAVVKANIDIIVKIGLEPNEEQDILLVRDSCRALLSIKTGDPFEAPLKRENDDPIFTALFTLLTSNFLTSDIDPYVSFATDAIGVIYHLANKPGKLIRKILLQINSQMGEAEGDSSRLAKLLYIIGHAAVKHMAYLDTALYKEFKRRNAIVEAKKAKKNQTDQRSSNISVCSSASISVHSSARKARQSIYRKQQNHSDTTTTEDTGEEAIVGATADDADAEEIETELENDVVNGDGLFAYFVPIVLDVCQFPENYKCQYVQAFGVQTLTKMMSISSQFCQQHLQLLITILERSSCPEIRGNILIGLADLMTRFPNEVEPWTAHLYGRLRDPEVSVRSTAVRILANLVKREMIRVKGQMSEMALCIMDANPQIRLEAKQFFFELSQKSNILYNILPDILSRLTSEDVDIEEDNFHQIVKHILGLLQKEREIDALLDKICQRLKMSVNDRQCRDLAYCLSLLQLGKKGIVRLTANLPLIKNKLHIREVQRALKDIVESARKKPENKDICGQLENEIDRLLDSDEAKDSELKDEDREAMPPPMAPPRSKTPLKKMKKQRKKSSSDEDEDSEVNDKQSRSRVSSVGSTPRSRNSLRLSKRKSNSVTNGEESSFEEPNKRRLSNSEEPSNRRSSNSEEPSKRKSSTSSRTSSPSRKSNGSVAPRRSLRKNREESPKENQLPPPKRTRTNGKKK